MNVKMGEILHWRFAIAPLVQNDTSYSCHPEYHAAKRSDNEGSPPGFFITMI